MARYLRILVLEKFSEHFVLSQYTFLDDLNVGLRLFEKRYLFQQKLSETY